MGGDKVPEDSNTTLQPETISILPGVHYVPVFLFTSFFNNVIGISDPGQLNPPDFCPDAEIEDGAEEPVDFISLFLKQ